MLISKKRFTSWLPEWVLSTSLFLIHWLSAMSQIALNWFDADVIQHSISSNILRSNMWCINAVLPSKVCFKTVRFGQSFSSSSSSFQSIIVSYLFQRIIIVTVISLSLSLDLSFSVPSKIYIVVIPTRIWCQVWSKLPIYIIEEVY